MAAEGMLPPIVVELLAQGKEFSAQMKEASGEVDKFEGKSTSSMSKTAKLGKAALLGLGGAAIAVGGFALEMADTYEKSHARLEAALKANGTSFDEQQKSIDKVERSMENLGFTNAETEGALANLTTALGDPKKAMDDMGTAADLARFKNISLSQASVLVAKAAEGQTAPLKRLGIDLPIVAGGAAALKNAQVNLAGAQQKLTTYLKIHTDALNVTSKAHGVYLQMVDKVHQAQAKLGEVQTAGTNIMDALQKKIGGQAVTASKTFAGKVLDLKVKVEDLGAKLGMVLIPIIEKVINIIMQVVNWFEQHKAVAIALGVVIGGVLLYAITAYIAGLVAAGVASVTAAAELLLPWAPLIAAVALVALAGYELVKHWKQIWDGIKDIVLAVWHFIDDDIVHPIEKAFEWLVNTIKTVLSVLYDILVKPYATAFDWVTGHINDFVNFFTSIPGKLAALGAHMFDWLWDAFKWPINMIIKGWNSLHFKLPKISIPFVGTFGGEDIGLPQIPLLAKGGNITGAGAAIVGDNGPELLNLPSGAKVTPLTGGGGSSSGGGGGGTFTIEVPVVLDGREIARVVTPAVRQDMLRTGRGLPGIFGGTA